MRIKLRIIAGRMVIAATLIGSWELAGQNPRNVSWIGRPSEIIVRLISGFWGEHLLGEIGTTLLEVVVGLPIGACAGAVLGFVLGRRHFWASALNPIIIALYSVPLLALGPLLILWFGIGLMPKIVLVAAVVFFLVFFNAYQGTRAVDPDLVSAVLLMGGSERDVLVRVVLPSCLVWILVGLRIAIPYSLIAAVAGEMMVSQSGLGAVLMKASGMFDVPGLFAVLAVLAVLSGGMDAGTTLVERRFIKWRNV